MTIEDEIRSASEKFYSALNRTLNGDAGPMGEIWFHSATVTAMSPLGGCEVGWDQVRRSWERVAQVAAQGHVRVSDQFIQVYGDVAYELGVEYLHVTLAGQLETYGIRVTNIYHRESGGWKIVHHHTDIAQSAIDALSRPEKIT